MMSGIEQFQQLPAVGKAQLESQLDMMTAVAQTGFDGFAKLTALNIGAVKAALEEYPQAARQRLAANTPQEWLATANAQVAPQLEKVVQYGRQLTELALATQADFGRVAQQGGTIVAVKTKK